MRAVGMAFVGRVVRPMHVYFIHLRTIIRFINASSWRLKWKVIYALMKRK